MMEPKSAAESAVSLAQIVLPIHTNVAGNMHGGEVMKLMDTAAGVVAQRHSLSNVVTASVTQLSFIEPIFLGDLVICNAELTYTGSTSLEVYVCVKAENLNKGELKKVVEGYFFMVALDRNGRPTKIPPLRLETEKQKQCFEEARERIMRVKKKQRG